VTVAESQSVGHRVPVHGMQLYYEVSGAGDPIVVLHGSYMNIPTMGGIIPKLAQTRRVYALELQGHGRTTDIDRPITFCRVGDNALNENARPHPKPTATAQTASDPLGDFVEQCCVDPAPHVLNRTNDRDTRNVVSHSSQKPRLEVGWSLPVYSDNRTVSQASRTSH